MEAKDNDVACEATLHKFDCKDVSYVPMVSVIVPVYKAEETIERCVESVLAQSFSDWELLLIDDGSPDNSGSICDAYAMVSSRVRVIHQQNQGVSAARNKGIELAHGAYLFFLDSDDYIEIDALDVYVKYAKDTSADIVIGGLQVIGEQAENYQKQPPVEGVFGVEIFETICMDCEIFGYAGGKCFRSSIVKEHNLRFRTDMQSQEDLEFFLSVYRHCERFCLLRFTGYRYEFIVGKRVPPIWDFISNQLKLLRVSGEVVVLSNEAHAAVRQRIVTLLFSCLHSAVEQNSYADVWHALNAVDGLRVYLRSVQGKGERIRVARWFAGGYRRLIYMYMALRLFVRRIVCVFRK